MFARFLFFSGGWEGESNFFALESEKDIIILSCGKSAYQSSPNEFQKIGFDFIKENSHKVKAIIVSNINFQNIGYLDQILNILKGEGKNDFIIYARDYTKMFFSYLSLELDDNFVLVNEDLELILGDFFINFFFVGSGFLGNFAFCINFLSKYTFYFFESFSFSNILENEIIFPESNLNKLQKFLTPKNEKVYLILSCQGLHWQNKNSIFFISQDISSLRGEAPNVFVFYDFDWLHILELIEIIKRKNKKLIIIDPNFFDLINKVLNNKKTLSNCIQPLGSEINGGDFYLLTSNSSNIKTELKKYLDKKKNEEKEKNHFIVGMPPFIGGEENLAKVIDYLYSQTDLVTNLSKTEYFSSGVSFYDLKYLLKILKPDFLVTYQNSYKNSKYFSYLSLNHVYIPIYNSSCIDLSEQKIFQLERKKNLISINELLERQRGNLKKNGLLMIVLVIHWKLNELKLSRITIENLAVNFDLDVNKLKEKIKKWWKIKLTIGIKRDNFEKSYDKIIKKRLNLLLLEHFKNNLDLELEEFLILIF